MRLVSPWPPRLADIAAPIHERLVAALAEDIAEGVIGAGARLPPHRDLAYRLGIGLGTVTRAYGLLERRGLVKSERGRGMFVVGGVISERTAVDLSVNVPPHMLADRLLAATFQMLARDMDSEAFNRYRPPAGSPGHRRLVAHWLSEHRFKVTPDRLLLTNGAQHALSVAFALACGATGKIFTEAVSYPGALALVRYVGLTARGVAIDDEGIRPDALDAALAANGGRHCAVYVTPTLHNPTTATMSLSRRREIANICRARDVLVIEDDVYSLFTPSGLPALAEMAPERTLYVSGLSKMLSPGLRLGLLAVPPEFVDKARAGIQATCSMASPLSCFIMERWVTDGTVASIGASIRIEAEKRTALARTTLPELVAPRDSGSLHVWLPMPLADAERTARRAAAFGVTVTPPSAVTIDSAALSGIRLCLGGPKRSDLSWALAELRSLLDQGANENAETSIMV